MTLPFTFPDWVPWWFQLVVVIVVSLCGLAFLLMPFSVFGVKARLDAIEARLDEVQGEIRSLALRLPEAPLGTTYDDLPAMMPARPRRNNALPERPPIPPAPLYPDSPPHDEALFRPTAGERRRTEPPPPRQRSEPRLNFPRE
ncbi:MAG TPA: hypothetical protein VMI52_14825 [Acetobacteraceae bacterium]|nr:hypothetical protein [Acetobacteraceae bacterium]